MHIYTVCMCHKCLALTNEILPLMFFRSNNKRLHSPCSITSIKKEQKHQTPDTRLKTHPQVRFVQIALISQYHTGLSQQFFAIICQTERSEYPPKRYLFQARYFVFYDPASQGQFTVFCLFLPLHAADETHNSLLEWKGSHKLTVEYLSSAKQQTGKYSVCLRWCSEQLKGRVGPSGPAADQRSSRNQCLICQH